MRKLLLHLPINNPAAEQRGIKPSPRINRKLLLQFLLVFTAFLIMVIISSSFASHQVSKSIASYGREVMARADKTFETILMGYAISLEDIAFSMERLRSQNGADINELRDELQDWFDLITSKDEQIDSLTGVHAVVDDTLITGSKWMPPPDYSHKTRPWYIGAYKQGGAIHYSDIYRDAETNSFCITLSRLLFDSDNTIFGVLAVKLYTTSLYEFTNSLSLMNSGYGVILNSEIKVVVHPNESLVGKPLASLNEGYDDHAKITQNLINGNIISAFNFTTTNGEKSVAFCKRLFNGSYIGIIAPSESYYSEVTKMQIIMSVTGFVLMILLCAVLTLMHIRVQRSDEANRIKTSFLANMSHEIRTPMNAIIGMSELLQQEELNHRQMGYVNDVNSSAHSLLSIINDILDLSRIESGKLELSPIDFDFYAFLDNITSMFRFVVRKKELEFKFESSDDLPPCLFGDDIRLRQVLTNICGNAVKFTENGNVKLKVYTSDNKLFFEISDTGIGIRKEDMPKLFDAFAQVDVSKNRDIVGTGLGLSISKSFVEMMGGAITVKSEYGRGTIFTVMIPLVQGKMDNIRYRKELKKEKHFSAPTAGILVVDDNEFNLKVAVGLLSLYRIDAKVAFSGREAIDMIRQNDFDIVFMDHMMPEMDGIEATLEIRKLGTQYAHLPVIALTANAIRGAREMFLENGFNDLVTKPVDSRELNRVLEKWLPPEKIKRRAESEISGQQTQIGESPEIEDFFDALRKIAEINTKTGLKYVSGMKEMYYKTIKLFHKKLISECEKMSAFINSGDMNGFSISIHAMKSMLASIGAERFSDSVFELEIAAKKNDLLFCTKKFPKFKEKLLYLNEHLSVIFPKREGNFAKEQGTAACLRENVQKALNAANDFNNDASRKAVNVLLSYDFGAETNTLLESAMVALKNFDFDRAIESLEAINQRIGLREGINELRELNE
ncbi:MAG: response regulator [Treponema sp.]|jgi:signal transduction histidine kinase/DNA-binding NarL/FixJ family response regulator|nr:response regulator [Treponema sp.]